MGAVMCNTTGVAADAPAPGAVTKGGLVDNANPVTCADKDVALGAPLLPTVDKADDGNGVRRGPATGGG